MNRLLLAALCVLPLMGCEGGDVESVCDDEVCDGPPQMAPEEEIEFWETIARQRTEEEANPGTYLGFDWDPDTAELGTSCSPNATPTTRCSYACIDPQPPPPNEDPAHGLNCCACTSWYGGCGSPSWCSTNGAGIGKYSEPEHPPRQAAACLAGDYCTKCSDAPQYLPGTTDPNPFYPYNDWRGHSAGPDGLCGNDDDVYNKPPPP